CGLRIYWHEQFGASTPIEPGMHIDQALIAEGVWEEIDLADFYDDLQEFFGFPWALNEFCRHFRIDEPVSCTDLTTHGFTFGALAEYIRERVERVSFEPITLLGRRCSSAGSFRGIEELVHRTDRSVPRFGPSTPIKDRLRGRTLHAIYARLRWISVGRLPAPRS